jgi:hypothetical protein
MRGGRIVAPVLVAMIAIIIGVVSYATMRESMQQPAVSTPVPVAERASEKIAPPLEPAPPTPVPEPVVQTAGRRSATPVESSPRLRRQRTNEFVQDDDLSRGRHKHGHSSTSRSSSHSGGGDDDDD